VFLGKSSDERTEMDVTPTPIDVARDALRDATIGARERLGARRENDRESIACVRSTRSPRSRANERGKA